MEFIRSVFPLFMIIFLLSTAGRIYLERKPYDGVYFPALLVISFIVASVLTLIMKVISWQ